MSADSPNDNAPTHRAVEHFDALRPGTVLGKYRVEKVLGQGGFGITYRAIDSSLDRAVAIKEYLPSDVAVRVDGTTIKPRSTADQENFTWGLTRFLDEARSLAKFGDVPAVVRVFDFMEMNGSAYMVMELVEGESLAELYRREAPLSEERLLSILLPLTQGLEIVHGLGFLHRDIKPANILLKRDGAPVLIDFGAARSALGDKSRSMTAVFTPGYAPFEQYMSAGKQGPWTDIYALAATLYHGVTGKVPPPAAERVYEDPMPPASEAGAGRYDPWFLSAIDRGLAVQEKMRPQSVAEWRALFTAAAPAGAAPTQVVRARPPADAPATVGHAAASLRGTDRPASGSKRFASRRALLFGGGLGGLAAAAAVALTLSSGTMSVVQAPANGKPTELAAATRPESPDERARRLTEEAQKATEGARRAQLAAESEARRQAEQEARRQAEEQARRQAELERQKAEDEARKRAAEEQQRQLAQARQAADAEAKRQAEDEAKRLAAEEARRRAEAERKAADEARRKIEAELAEARRQAEEARRVADELRQRADAERKAAEDAKLKAEQQAKSKAEEDARKKIEADAKAKLDAEAKQKADADAKKKTDEEAAKKKADAEAAKKKSDEEAKQKAQQQAAAPASNQADATGYLARHDGVIRAMIAEALKRDYARFQSSIRPPNLIRVESPQFRAATRDTVLTIARATMSAESVSRPVTLHVTIRGYPNAPTGVELELADGSDRQQAAAPATTHQAYLAQHDAALKQAIVRQITGRPDDYVESSVKIESARVGALTNVVVQGDTLRASGLVEMRTSRYSQSSSSTMYVNIVVRGFPSSAQLVSVERAAGKPAPQVAAAPAAGQADGVAYLARHDGAIKAAVSAFMMRDPARFQSGNRQPTSVSIGAIQLARTNGDILTATTPTTMNFGGFNYPVTVQITIRGFPATMAVIDVDRLGGSAAPQASNPAGAPDAAQYLAKHWPSLKSQIESDALANPRKYQTRGLTPGSAVATLLRMESQSGDAMVILVKVRLVSRDGQNFDGADVRVTVKGFPDSARFAEAN